MAHHSFSRRLYGDDETYVEQYTRGLLGVTIPLDHFLSQILCAALGLICVIVLLIRWMQRGHAHLRLAMTTELPLEKQTFWGLETSRSWRILKKHFLYAPLGHKRHHREIKISNAANMGVVPSRLHSFLIGLYIATQISYVFILSYGRNERAAIIAELRGRSGSLAVLNMVPLAILAGRNNPLLSLLGISFDTSNLIHRWFGRIVAVESLLHTIAWAVNAVSADGVRTSWYRICTDLYFTSGFIGTCGMAFLLCHSPSPFRHAFYETFLHAHQLMAFTVIVVVWIHLHIDKLPQLPWYPWIVVFWFSDRFFRLVRLVWLNCSSRNGTTKTEVLAMDGGACRVTFRLPGIHHFPAGSHVYAYFPEISFHMSHPFSVAWAETYVDCYAKDEEAQHTDEKSPPNHGQRGPYTAVSLIIAKRAGMTHQLFNATRSHQELTNRQLLCLCGAIEGPYTSYPASFTTYGTVLLFSGGVGITHHLLHARQLLEAYAAGATATRCIYLFWSVRHAEQLAWAEPFIRSLINDSRRDDDMLVVKAFVSRPAKGDDAISISPDSPSVTTRQVANEDEGQKEDQNGKLEAIDTGPFDGQPEYEPVTQSHESPSITKLASNRKVDSSKESHTTSSTLPTSHIQQFIGRCCPQALLAEVMMELQQKEHGTGAVAVSVCGPGGFADEVRAAVRERIGKGVVMDYFEEGFSW